MHKDTKIDSGAIFQKRFAELVDNATQEEVARKVNTSRQNVGNWLNGKTRPDINAISEIAKGFGVSTDYLLGLTDVKTSDTTVQNICKYTGLNEKACFTLWQIEHIEQTTGIYRHSGPELMKICNALIANEAYQGLLSCIASFIKAYTGEPGAICLNTQLKKLIGETENLLSGTNLKVVPNSSYLLTMEYEAIEIFKQIFKEICRQ